MIIEHLLLGGFGLCTLIGLITGRTNLCTGCYESKWGAPAALCLFLFVVLRGASGG